MFRRDFLRGSLLATGSAVLNHWADPLLKHETRRFLIGACDWSIGQRGKLDAFDVARELDLDGIQVSARVKDFEPLLARPEILGDFRQKSISSGVDVGSLALGLLNEFPYKSDDRTQQWVIDSLHTAKSLGTKIVLLAFFGAGDLKDDPIGKKEVIAKLKDVAPLAEDLNIFLGIESWLSAEEHVEMLEAVGSSHIKVYYDVANSHKMGYNIYDEIRWLGKERICEFHAKENGFLLGSGNVDLNKVRDAIDDIEYEGWIQIEGAVPENADLMESYRHNVRVMREIF